MKSINLFFIMLFIYLLGCTGQTLTIKPATHGINTNGEYAHELFTKVLQEYVSDGKVNYSDLCEDNRLEQYISELAATNPEAIADQQAKLAFWINAYNAYTLKVICDNYPVESINDLHFGGLIIGSVFKKTIWDKKFVLINNKKISLNYIEHKIIRAMTQDPHAHFSQVCTEMSCPRAHFALVCASKSCPPLRSEAYEGHKLNQQLNDQARTFFSDMDKNYFDIDKKEVHISKILDWFAKDFGMNDEEVLLFVAHFLPGELAAAIQSNPKNWRIKHTKYDWSLNE